MGLSGAGPSSRPADGFCWGRLVEDCWWVGVRGGSVLLMGLEVGEELLVEVNQDEKRDGGWTWIEGSRSIGLGSS